MHCTWHRWEEDGPGEVLRQQHKEHDADRPNILSHIDNCDLLQESHTDNNDQDTQTLWRSASSAAMFPYGAVAEPRRLTVHLRLLNSHMIRIN